MNLERFFILLLLFVMAVFFFGDIETAVNGISVAEALQPVFLAVPYLILGSLFFAFILLGVLGGND